VQDDDHWRALERWPQPLEPELQVRQRDGQQRERRHGEHRADERPIVTRDALLDQIADGDQQDQLEAGELGQLLAAHRARDEPHE
jgi:hypothetical protein